MYSNEQLETTASAKMMGRGVKLALAGVGLALLLEPSIAAAAGTPPWEAALSNISHELTGALGKSIAVIAVIVLGMMAMFGKLEWMTAAKVVGGIVVVFSAGQIINWISPNVGASIDAPNAQVCQVRGGAWIQESILVADAMGVVSPTVPAHCVAADSVVEACAATVSGESMSTAALQAAATANNRNIPTYYTATIRGALTCS